MTTIHTPNIKINKTHPLFVKNTLTLLLPVVEMEALPVPCPVMAHKGREIKELSAILE